MGTFEIRVRVALAVTDDDHILLVPHYHTDAGDIQWVIPGGRLEFGEPLRKAAEREFLEETGMMAEVLELLDVSEAIILDRPYHSITITFRGKVTRGAIRAEPDHP